MYTPNTTQPAFLFAHALVKEALHYSLSLFYSIAQISHMYYNYLNMYQILCFVFYK